MLSEAQLKAAVEREAQTQAAVRRRRERLAGIVQSVVPGLVGIILFLLFWQGVSQIVTNFPGPVKVWDSAVKLFSDPFYRKGPNDQGIGWNILASLQRVGLGFGLAALVGIPAGFMIGRFVTLDRMTSPIISILRPVSPLAWLPIGLMVFKAANGIGFWLWDEWNNLLMEHIIIAIFTIGIIGWVLEHALIWVAKRFQFD